MTEAPARLAINSRAEAEQALQRGARLSARKSRAEAGRDTAVVRAQQTNAKTIAEVSSELDEIKEALETWAKANREDFSGQSLVADFGALSFRRGNPEVTFLEDWKLKDVLAKMVRKGKVLARYLSWIRIKFELHKQNILSESARRPEATNKKLAAVGLQVTQEESFEVVFVVHQEL